MSILDDYEFCEILQTAVVQFVKDVHYTRNSIARLEISLRMLVELIKPDQKRSIVDIFKEADILLDMEQRRITTDEFDKVVGILEERISKLRVTRRGLDHEDKLRLGGKFYADKTNP